MRNPFVGLRPFGASDEDLFFGRDREVAILGNLVRTLPVLIVYAPSGTGKSSIVNAGLCPALALDQGLVVVVVSDSSEDIMDKTLASLAQSGWRVPIDVQGEGLVPTLQAHFEETGRRVIVIVDQFEERMRKPADLDSLYGQIARLTNSSSDAATIVLSLREDYLGDLEPLMRRVSGLLDASYRIPVLGRAQLEQAVYGPLKAVGDGVTAEDALVDRVLSDLGRGPASEPSDGRFEAGYFQVVWSRLWTEDVRRPGDRITLGTYDRLGGADSILESFVAQVLTKLLPSEAETLSAMLRYLVLPTGAKVALTVDDLVWLIRPDDLTKVGRLLYGLASPFDVGVSADRLRWRLRSHIDQVTLRLQIVSVFQQLTRTDAPLFRRVIRNGRTEFELVHDLIGKTLLNWRVKYERDPLRLEERGLREDKIRNEPTVPSIGDPAELAAVKPLAMRLVRAWTERLSKLPAPLPIAAPRLGATAGEIREIGRSASDISRALRVLRLTRGGSKPLSGFAKQLERLLPNSFESLMTDQARDDRGLLQQFVLDCYILFLEPRQVIRFKHRPLAWLLSAVATFVGFAVADLLLRDALTSLGVEYRFLTLAFPAILTTLIYGFVATATPDWRRPTATALFPPIRPPLPSGAPGPHASAVSVRRIMATVGTWWPIPLLLIEAIGLGGALTFDGLGFASTAGFNVGILLGSLGTGAWYVTIQEQ